VPKLPDVGIVARYTMELLLGKVESIGVQQKLLGRLITTATWL